MRVAQLNNVIDLNLSFENNYWMNVWEGVCSEIMTDQRNIIDIRMDPVSESVTQKQQSVLVSTIPKIIQWIENWLTDQFSMDLKFKVNSEIKNNEIELSSISAFIPINVYSPLLFVLSCNADISEKLVASFNIIPEESEKEEFMIDVVSELTNIIVGNSMQWLGGDEEHIDFGYPVSILTLGIKLNPVNSKWVIIDFETKIGRFEMYVLLPDTIDNTEIGF